MQQQQQQQANQNQNAALQPIPINCSKHQDVDLEYYCRTCDEPICRECTFIDHHSHEHEQLSDIAPKHVEQLLSVIDEGRKKISEFNVTLKTLEHNKSKLQIQYAKAQNDIHETFQLFQQMLDDYRQKMAEELDDVFNTRMTSLNVLTSKVEEIVRKSQQISLFSERIRKLTSPAELFVFKQMLDNKLQPVYNFNPDINTIPHGDLEFVSNFQSIQQAVHQTFGFIKATSSTMSDMSNVNKQPPISRPQPNQQQNGTLSLSNTSSNNQQNNSNNASIQNHQQHIVNTTNGFCSPSPSPSSMTNGHINGTNPTTVITSNCVTSNGIIGGLGGVTSHSNGGYQDSLLQKIFNSNHHQTSPVGSGSTGNGSSLSHTNSSSSSSSRQSSITATTAGLNGSAVDTNGNVFNNGTTSLTDSITSYYEKWSLGGAVGSLGGTGSPDLVFNPVVANNSALTTTDHFNSALNDPLMDLSAKLINSASLLPIKSQCKRQKMIYHCKFGEFGVMEGQFTEPSGVAVNAQNDIIVADTNNHRIQIFDKEGRFKFQFGECGKRDGQLLYPNRVAVVKNSGDIIVTERSPTHQIQIYNQYGQFVRKFGANILQHPRGVTVDNKGRIIVVECKVMRVIIFDQMGNALQKFGCSKHLEFPNGVVVNDKQEIFISDNRAHCVKVFSYEGVFLRQIGGEGLTNYPIGVCINDAGEILVADNHNNFNITIFSQDGSLINALESKVKHAQCFDVALMDDNSVVLASKDYRIYIYRYLQVQALAAIATFN